jgi:ABC-2 type transport system ATP-binding protein
MHALEINGLEKTYTVGLLRKKERQALKPFQLTVETGEIFGYLGPNGAGKTTTLKILMGLIFPTAGSAKILDRHMWDPKVNAQLGFLPEQPYFYDYLTGGELLDYLAQLSGVPARDRKRKVDEMLARVGMSGAKNLQLRKFSKGMLQRVGIAQAIVHDPKIVFLDEPMSGLDPIGRREVADLIRQLKDDGKTVFFSTHILSDAEALCDRVAVIHEGMLRGVGVVADLVSTAEGKTEILWHGPAAIDAVSALGCQCRTSGDVIRAVIDEAKLDVTLDTLRRFKARLVSVNPIRPTLEDYFVERIGGIARKEAAS